MILPSTASLLKAPPALYILTDWKEIADMTVLGAIAFVGAADRAAREMMARREEMRETVVAARAAVRKSEERIIVNGL